jgi:hypothetical protein
MQSRVRAVSPMLKSAGRFLKPAKPNPARALEFGGRENSVTRPAR